MMQYSPPLHNFIVNKHVFLLQQAIGAVSLFAIVLREQWLQLWLHYANISPHELPFQIKKTRNEWSLRPTTSTYANPSLEQLSVRGKYV